MHRTLLVGTLSAVLLLSVAGSAQASEGLDESFGIDRVRIEVGPDALLIHVDGAQVEGREASEVRAAIDSTWGGGDADGTVTETERRGAEAFTLAALNAAAPNHFDLSLVTIDGKNPGRAEDRPFVQVRELSVSGAEGAVTSTAPIRLDFTLLVYFENVQQGLAAHTVRFENICCDLGFESDLTHDVEIQVSGYNTWTVDGETVTPAALRERLDGDTFVFTNEDLRYFSQEGSGLEFVVRGDPNDRILSDVHESPVMPVLALALFGLAGLAFLRRRA